jgi:ureidoglycolate dehydrogenase (NAD+)
MELIRVASDELLEWCVRKLTDVGVPEDHAKITADVLVHANLRGVDSHGVLRMEHYVNKISAGGINPVPNMSVSRTGPVTAIVNGDDGLGHVVAHRAMETALELAEQNGVGVVGAVNSSHCGALSYFVEMATERNMIGVVMSNTDKTAVPFGGREPFFGTNPMAFGFPARRHPPIILDMATTTVAFGKILDHKLKGKPIPPDWAVDREGESVTDPDQVYALQHFGGAKGYGLALVVDVFSSILFGAAFGPHVETMYADDLSRKRKLAQFFLALNPSYFIEVDAFLDTMDRMIDEIHAVPPARGFERVLVPGEPENLSEWRRLREGIPLPEEIVRYLRGH